MIEVLSALVVLISLMVFVKSEINIAKKQITDDVTALVNQKIESYHSDVIDLVSKTQHRINNTDFFCGYIVENLKEHGIRVPPLPKRGENDS
jgi:hypothetical protein